MVYLSIGVSSCATVVGPKFGYFPDATKSWVIVKVKTENKVKDILGGSGIIINTNGKPHLKASLASDKYKDTHLASNANEWVNELGILSDIAKPQLLAAYSAFITGFRHKLIYYHQESINTNSTSK